MAKAGTDAWMNDFVASLQASNSQKNNEALSPGRQALRDALNSVFVDVPSAEGGSQTVAITPEMARNLASPRDFSEPQGPVQWTLDKLLRPLYGTSQGLVSLVGNLATNSDELKAKGIEPNPLKAFWQGFSGENKDTYVDLLSKAGANPYVAGTVGLAGDLALDPLNAAGGPIGKIAEKIAEAAKGATKAGKVAKQVDIADQLKEAENARLADEASKNASLDNRITDLKANILNDAANSISSPYGNASGTFSIDLSDLTSGAYNDAQLAKLASKGDFADSVLGDLLRNKVPETPVRPNRATRRANKITTPEFNFADSIMEAMSKQAEKPRFYMDEGTIKFASPRKDIDALLRGEIPTEIPAEVVVETPKPVVKPTKPATPKQAAKETHANMSGEARVKALLERADALEDEITKYQVKAARDQGPLAVRQQVATIDQVTSPKDYFKFAESKDSFVQSVLSDLRRQTYEEGFTHGAQIIEQHNRALKEIKNVESAEIAKGNFQHVRSGPNAEWWPLQTSQQWEFLDKYVRPVRTKEVKTAEKSVPSVTLSGSQQIAIPYFSFVPASDLSKMFAKALDLADTKMSWATRKEAIFQAGKQGTRGSTYSWHEADSTIPKFDARKRTSVENRAKNAAGALASHTDELKAIVQANMEAVAKSEVQAGRIAGTIVSDAVVSDFNIAGKGSVSKAVTDLTEPNKLVKEATQNNEVAKLAASEKVADTLAKISNPEDVKVAKDLKKSVKEYQKPAQFAVNGIRDAGFQRAKFTAQQVEDDLINKFKVSPEEYPATFWAEVEKEIVHSRSPLTGVFTRFGKNAGEFGVDYRSGTSYYLTVHRDYSEALGQLHKKYNPAILENAFEAIKHGDIDTLTNNTIRSAATELEPLVKELFDLDNPLYNIFHRNGIRLSDISRELKLQGFHRDLFNAEVPPEIASQGQEAINKHIADSWKELEVSDPLEFLDKVHGAAMVLNIHRSVAQQMSRYAVTAIPKGAVEEGIKYVMLPEKFGESSRILQYAPKVDIAGNTLKYPEPVIKQITQLERELNISYRPDGDGFFSNKVVRGFVDPAMAIFKPLVTIVNPQHNIRNLLSDLYLNYMDGVKTLTPYRKALSVFSDAGHLPDSVQSHINRILRTGDKGAPKYKYVTVKLSNGSTSKLNTATLFRMLEKDGILPGFHQTEDIFSSGNATGLWKYAKKTQDFKPVQIGAKISEVDTHIMRAAQYIHNLENGTYKSLRAARLKATERSMNFHPDTTGLSPEAKKYMRRIFPFYSWFRQIMPVVFETAVTRPARITALSKALHSAQTMTGNNEPGTSIVNPFPVTRNIPSFMKEQIGYIGGDFVFNVGTPVEAMADIFNGNINRNIVGMVNPLAKIPIEAMSGTNLGLGTKITDWSEWADRQIPIVSKAEQISGYSPTGTISNIVTGGNTGGPGPLDPSRAVAKDEKQAFFNTSLFNYFTGIGLQNINRASYENIARREDYNSWGK